VDWNNPCDLFIIPQMRRSSLRFSILPVPEDQLQTGQANYQMRCKHCPASSSRLFTPEGVKRHLYDK
jgi:hypothetical protein